MAINDTFLAYVDSSNANSSWVGVVPLSSTGNKRSKSLIKGHTSQVKDFAFDPFEKKTLVTCSTDATMKLWNIPEGGLVEDYNSAACSWTAKEKELYEVFVSTRVWRDWLYLDLREGCIYGISYQILTRRGDNWRVQLTARTVGTCRASASPSEARLWLRPARTRRCVWWTCEPLLVVKWWHLQHVMKVFATRG